MIWHGTKNIAKLHPCKLIKDEYRASPSSKVNVSTHATNLVFGLVLCKQCLGDDSTGMMPRLHDTAGRH